MLSLSGALHCRPTICLCLTSEKISLFYLYIPIFNSVGIYMGQSCSRMWILLVFGLVTISWHTMQSGVNMLIDKDTPKWHLHEPLRRLIRTVSCWGRANSIKVRWGSCLDRYDELMKLQHLSLKTCLHCAFDINGWWVISITGHDPVAGRCFFLIFLQCLSVF